MTSVLITTAAVVAALAAVRAVMLGLDFDGADAAPLGHALVVHGAAVVALGVVVVIGAGLQWPLDVLIGAFTLSWGGTLVLVGRSYDTSEERLAAELRDERPARARPLPKRFGRGAAEQSAERQRSGGSTQT